MALLIGLADLPTPMSVENPVKGRYFFVTTVDRAEFVALVPAIVRKILDMTLPTAEPPVEELTEAPDGESGLDE